MLFDDFNIMAVTPQVVGGCDADQAGTEHNNFHPESALERERRRHRRMVGRLFALALVAVNDALGAGVRNQW